MNRLILFTCAFSLLLSSCSDERMTLTIGAAASLALPLAEAADSFAVRFPDIDVTISTAASNVIVRQTLEGGPYDLVILASPSLMERLDTAGAIDRSTIRIIGTNRLCLVVPDRIPTPKSLDDLRSPAFDRIAIGAPGVPVGEYAREVFEASGLMQDIESKIIHGRNARDVLRYVEIDEVDAALVYRSDAVEGEGIRIALTVDSALHEPILYPAAVPIEAGSVGEAFVDFLVDGGEWSW